jgi:DNA polymerase III alpha subunit
MIGDIDEDSNGNYVTLVGQINSFQPLFRKRDGEAMGKFVLEDLTGEIDCICFTKTFKEYKDFIKEGAVVILKGRVMADVEKDPETNEVLNSEIQIAVSEIAPVSARQKVYVKLPTIFDWKEAKALFEKYPGPDPLYVYFEVEGQVYEAKNTVRGCRELKEIFCNIFSDKSFAIKRGA